MSTSLLQLVIDAEVVTRRATRPFLLAPVSFILKRPSIVIHTPLQTMYEKRKTFEDTAIIPLNAIDLLTQGLENLRKQNGKLRSPEPESHFWFPT